MKIEEAVKCIEQLAKQALKNGMFADFETCTLIREAVATINQYVKTTEDGRLQKRGSDEPSAAGVTQ